MTTLRARCVYWCMMLPALVSHAVCLDIQLAFLAPFNTVRQGCNVSVAVPGIASAVKMIEDHNILPDGYQFNVSWYNTRCDIQTATGILLDLYTENKVDIVIGPGCPQVLPYMCTLCSHWKLPLVTWVPHTLVGTDTCPTLVRGFSDYTLLGEVLQAFFSTVNWTTAALVHMDTQGDIYSAVNGKLQSAQITITRLEEDADNIEDLLHGIKKVSRVILLVISPTELRALMLAASALMMTTGEYVFIFITDVIPHEWMTTQQLWQNNDADDAIAKKALDSVLILSFINDISIDANNYSSWLDDSYNTALRSPLNTTVPDIQWGGKYTSLLATSLISIAHTIAEIVADGTSYNNGTAIASRMKGRIKFPGNISNAAGYLKDIVYDTNSDRLLRVGLSDLTDSGVFQTASYYTWNITDDGGNMPVFHHVFDINWPDGRTGLQNAPADTPECGLEGKDCLARELLLYLLLPMCLVTVFMVAFIVLAVNVYRVKQNQEAVKRLLLDVKYIDIIMSEDIQGSQKSFTSQESFESKDSDVTQAQSSTINTLATYQGLKVKVKFIRTESVELSNKLTSEIVKMRSINHKNLNRFTGACVEKFCVCTLWTYCSRGSLYDLIVDDMARMDGYVKMSLLMDIVCGMEYLHQSSLVSHGRLKSRNVVIDKKWVCKLTDYGLYSLHEGEGDDPQQQPHTKYQDQFWTAPELLRLAECPSAGTQTGDVYSYGIICKEILCRNRPYEEFEGITPKAIIQKVSSPEVNHGSIFRPSLANTENIDHSHALTHMVQQCWGEECGNRPTFTNIRKQLQKLQAESNVPSSDKSMSLLERYSDGLEAVISQTTADRDRERRKNTGMLKQLLPSCIIQDLQLGRPVEPQRFDSVAVSVVNIVGFSSIVSQSSPQQAVDLLNSINTLINSIIKSHDVYKLSSSCDRLMLSGGVPVKNGSVHCSVMAECCLDLLNVLRTHNIDHIPDRTLDVRIGMHTGAVIGAVIGHVLPKYCVFGDTVKTAAIMEACGGVNQIQLSEAMKSELDQQKKFVCTLRGPVEVLGTGTLFTYWLTLLSDATDKIATTTVNKAENVQGPSIS